MSRSGRYDQRLEVRVETRDLTARAGVHYTAQRRTVGCEPGEAWKAVTIPTLKPAGVTATTRFEVRVVPLSADALATPGADVAVVAITPPQVVVPTAPATIRALTAQWSNSALAAVAVRFSGPMGATAAARSNYRFMLAGADRQLGTRDDRTVAARSVGYDPATATARVVPQVVIRTGAAIALRLDGLRDARGRPRDGDADGRPGGVFLGVVPRPAQGDAEIVQSR